MYLSDEELKELLKFVRIPNKWSHDLVDEIKSEKLGEAHENPAVPAPDDRIGRRPIGFKSAS